MAPGRAQSHYQAHVAAGHCEEGKDLPLEVLDKTGALTDSDAEENGVLTEESVVDDLADVQEIEILSGQSVIEILTSPFKNQNDQENEKNEELLREGTTYNLLFSYAIANICELVHRAQCPNYRELNLTCPGPEMVIDSLVLGTEVCPNNTTISSATGLLTRNHGRVHPRIRCALCQARKNFNKVLLTQDLKAEPGQESCEHCLKPLWEGIRYCKDHMRSWAPETPSLCEASMVKVRDLFLKAASEQWSPKSGPMASILKKVKFDENATSDLLHIDLEFSTRSHKVYQIGISDSKGAKKLNCMPIYSKGVTTKLPSRSPWSQDFQGFVPYRMEKGQGCATDGTLNAERVAEKLGEMISKKTIFVSWGSWAFDVEYLREGLDEEEVRHKLPAKDKVCMLYHEFRLNMKDQIGEKCFKGHSFPLTLPFLFTLLFQGHDLVGMNHDALVDARQTASLQRLFLDLCKVPEKRVLFKGTLPIILPGMQSPVTNLL
ncbi:uncharacterized protein N7483_006777 [Penicillium malachiteum]|uniref:uncharacterized protein n=1 Tax=Penicillium malachiteum TaxID=1324776 RepID=UPI0025488E1A|nr:uncharacterized protein N7483_006777 [Penicillium malachiteum]KAJ5725420.1 hypothetical protein N7483_006777 [Penicillium malachiteum]